MLDFITRFFKREEASKTLAKERLRLVLMSDRVSLAPEVFEEMKCEMLAVIRRYLEIDERALDMHFENLERQFALLASIPVLKVKTPEPGGGWRPREIHTAANGAMESTATLVMDGIVPPANGAAAHAAGSNGSAPASPSRRRRRRRRAAGTPPPDAPPADGAAPAGGA